MQPTVALSADGFKHVVDGRLETPFSGSVVDRIEVDNHVRVIGNAATLEQLVAGKSVPATGVRSLVRKWRTPRDSNFYVVSIAVHESSVNHRPSTKASRIAHPHPINGRLTQAPFSGS